MEDNLVKKLRKSIRKKRPYKAPLIYLVGESALAKGNNEINSENEYKWGMYLYENQVRVPKMYMLVNPDSLVSRVLHLGNKIKDWYIIMERLKGQDIGDTFGTTREEAVRQYRQELEKVLDLGICPIDSSWGGNAIFGEDEKLYLIDFESWRNGSETELNKFYERIKNPEINFR